jgi:nucleoside-diphosphate-sugar epimerase
VGGNGFIGRAIVEELLRQGDECRIFDIAPAWNVVDPVDVEVIEGSILDRDALDAAFRGADEVYHLAGDLGTAELEDDPVSAIRTNILGAVNVFDAALATDVPCVFFPAKPNVWENVYTITKRTGEDFARLYSRTRPIAIPQLRLFNAFGPGQHLTPVRKLVPTLAVQAMRGLPLQVFGDGTQTVDMIAVRDLARLIIAFTRTRCIDAVPDCGRGEPMTVNAVAACVADHFGDAAGMSRCAPVSR